MRSSISSSEPAPLFYARLLVALCALVLVALECGYSYSLKLSGTYRRVSRQYADAVQSRPARPGEPVSVVMVGNSLLLDGVDVDRLQQLTAESLRVYPLFLEGTAYLDWFYGLRRLFHRGASPEVVIVGLGMDGLLDNAVRQEYVPRLLFGAPDVLAVSSEAGLDRTVTSSLLLAHWSAFWDMRHVIRVQILTSVPYFERLYLSDLWSDLKAKRVVPVGPEGEAAAVARLQRLRDLCERHGARLLDSGASHAIVAGRGPPVDARRVQGGRRGADAVNPATLPARFFRPDEIHVNEDGAAMFTAALASDSPPGLPRGGLPGSAGCTQPRELV